MGLDKKNYDILPELMNDLKREEEMPNLIIQQPQNRQRKSILRPLLFIVGFFGLFFVMVKVELPVTGTAHVVPSQLLIVEALESGIIENVNFTSGQQINKGDVIATLRNYDLVRNLQEAKLNRSMIRKKLLQLDRQRNYLRILVGNHEELYRDEIIARSELEKVKLEYTHSLQEYDIYKDEMESLRNKIDYYQEAFNNMKVIAPISAIILTRIENKLGTFVKKGDEICQVANMDDYLFELPINEKHIDNIIIGSKTTIRFSTYPHKPIFGTVTKIQHTAWEKIKKVLVKENVINVFVKPESTNLTVKPGMTAHIKIHSGCIKFRWHSKKS